VTKKLFLSFSFFIKKAWIWVKTNWKISIAIVTAIVLFFISRSRETDLLKIISHLKESHNIETNKLNDIHKKQLDDIEKANILLSDTMKQVEEKYAEKKEKLDKETKKKIEKLLSENKDDPGYIARELSEITGFKIYVKS